MLDILEKLSGIVYTFIVTGIFYKQTFRVVFFKILYSINFLSRIQSRILNDINKDIIFLFLLNI